jgi:hypothetical protein
MIVSQMTGTIPPARRAPGHGARHLGRDRARHFVAKDTCDQAFDQRDPYRRASWRCAVGHARADRAVGVVDPPAGVPFGHQLSTSIVAVNISGNATI